MTKNTTYVEPFYDRRGRRRVLMYRVRDDSPGAAGPFRWRWQAQRIADHWEAAKRPERNVR